MDWAGLSTGEEGQGCGRSHGQEYQRLLQHVGGPGHGRDSRSVQVLPARQGVQGGPPEAHHEHRGH
eukprot:5017381-Lingulodinium_polyedra.AAC.1